MHLRLHSPLDYSGICPVMLPPPAPKLLVVLDRKCTFFRKDPRREIQRLQARRHFGWNPGMQNT